MRVLITGGCGFIGSYVARDLIRAGHEVVATDVQNGGLLAEVVGGDLGADAIPQVHLTDMADVSSLVRIMRANRIDNIVHTAGLLSEGCAAAPARAAAVNIVGSGVVFELAAALDVQNVVWTSSISVFGYVAQDGRLDDDAPHVPNTFYGAYKSFNELQARLYHENLGVPSTGVRVGFAYGYGRTRGRGAWVHELLGRPALGLPGRVRGGDALVPWLYIEDASSAIVASLTAPADGARAFNTQGTPRWKREAVAAVRAVLPDADVELVGELEGYPTGLDDRRIREVTGWTPRFELEDGVRESIRRYRAAAGLPPVESAG
jgi:UDP-glucose 4-epimerase